MCRGWKSQFPWATNVGSFITYQLYMVYLAWLRLGRTGGDVVVAMHAHNPAGEGAATYPTYVVQVPYL
jgi:hypothetical protein